MKTKTILILILIVFGLVILFQNMENVTFSIFFWKIKAPQIILITVTLIIGLLIGYIAGTLQKKPSESVSRLTINKDISKPQSKE